MSTDAARLRKQLRELGLGAGTCVMVHASMRAVGPVEGRAEAVIQAILECIAPGGTMLMVLGFDSDEPFDALTSEVDVEDMGVLAEVFRTFEGVQVNDHAASRFAAIGPLADELLRDPPLHDYLGPGSPLERLVERDAVVLRLGADIDTVTLTHLAEYYAELPKKRRVRRRYLRADIGEQFIESLDDTLGIVDWPEGDYFSQLMCDYIAQGHAALGPVGQARAELLRARHFVDYAVQWMERELK